MVKANINGSVVTYESGEWATKDESLAEVLPLYEDSYWRVDGSYTPDRDLAIMQYVLEITGGKIVEHVAPVFEGDRIY